VESQAVLHADVADQIGRLWSRSDFALTDSQRRQLAAYLELLNKWNRVHSLTAIEDPSEQVQRHILDGLSIWPEIAARFGSNASIRVADVGSGMGVPGLVLAVVMPNIQMDLIERNQKKAAFLRHVCSRLNLTGRARVVEQDVSAIKPNPEYDLITSRAFAALPAFLELTLGISGPNTLWAAMLGRQKENESNHILIKNNNKIKELMVRRLVKINTPGVDKERHLAWVGGCA
jgi:16S rRNA (guanine527-N7)-methyltransferase